VQTKTTYKLFDYRNITRNNRKSLQKWPKSRRVFEKIAKITEESRQKNGNKWQ